MTKWIAVFSILMGVLQSGTWIVLFVNGTVARDYSSTPVQTFFLLIAEFLTAGAVIAGGLGILFGRKWGIPLSLSALGMMLYCVIYSCGVFGQLGVIPAVIWFGVVSVLTAAAIVGLLSPSFS